MKNPAKSIPMRHGIAWFFSVLVAASPCGAIEPPADTASPPEDVGWPRGIDLKKARLTCYLPQIDEWRDYRTLHARFAFSLTPSGEAPVLGVAEVVGKTTTDHESRTVVVKDLRITSSRIPSAKDADAIRLEALLKDNFPSTPMTVSLDRLLAGVKLAKGAADTVEVKMDPPPVFTSTTPAKLLMVEGKPVLSPADKVSLKFVVNTNWDVLFDETKGTYYLLSGDEWLTARDLAGPWSLAEALPESINQLPDDDTWKNVRQALPWSIRKGMILRHVIVARTASASSNHNVQEGKDSREVAIVSKAAGVMAEEGCAAVETRTNRKPIHEKSIRQLPSGTGALIRS